MTEKQFDKFLKIPLHIFIECILHFALNVFLLLQTAYSASSEQQNLRETFTERYDSRIDQIIQRDTRGCRNVSDFLATLHILAFFCVY